MSGHEAHLAAAGRRETGGAGREEHATDAGDQVFGGGGSLLDLVGVLPELASTEPVGLSLPVREIERPTWRMTLHPQQGPAFLAALREDRLAEWAARHPDAVNR